MPLLLLAACAPRPPTPQLPPPPSPREGVEELPAPACRRVTHVEVRKSEHRLVAFCDGGAQVEFSVALGRERGAKLRAGDERTPEGLYRVSGPPRPSRFHLFIPIDYPSTADAQRARDRGELSLGQYQEILRAIGAGSSPPHDTPLGGGLGFHGEGERWKGDSPYIDWTNGCIALADADIDFLVERIELGTSVEVLP